MQCAVDTSALSELNKPDWTEGASEGDQQYHDKGAVIMENNRGSIINSFSEDCSRETHIDSFGFNEKASCLTLSGARDSQSIVQRLFPDASDYINTDDRDSCHQHGNNLVVDDTVFSQMTSPEINQYCEASPETADDDDTCHQYVSTTDISERFVSENDNNMVVDDTVFGEATSSEANHHHEALPPANTADMHEALLREMISQEMIQFYEESPVSPEDDTSHQHEKGIDVVETASRETEASECHEASPSFPDDDGGYQQHINTTEVRETVHRKMTPLEANECNEAAEEDTNPVLCEELLIKVIHSQKSSQPESSVRAVQQVEETSELMSVLPHTTEDLDNGCRDRKTIDDWNRELDIISSDIFDDRGACRFPCDADVVIDETDVSMVRSDDDVSVDLAGCCTQPTADERSAESGFSVKPSNDDMGNSIQIIRSHSTKQTSGGNEFSEARHVSKHNEKKKPVPTETTPRAVRIQDCCGNELALYKGPAVHEHIRQIERSMRKECEKQGSFDGQVHSELASVMRDMLTGLVESPAEIRLLTDEQTFDTDGVLLAQVGGQFIVGRFRHLESPNSQHPASAAISEQQTIQRRNVRVNVDAVSSTLHIIREMFSSPLFMEQFRDNLRSLTAGVSPEFVQMGSSSDPAGTGDAVSACIATMKELFENPAMMQQTIQQFSDPQIFTWLSAMFPGLDFSHLIEESHDEVESHPRDVDESQMEIVEYTATETENNDLMVTAVMEHEGRRVSVQYTFYDSLPTEFVRYQSYVEIDSQIGRGRPDDAVSDETSTSAAATCSDTESVLSTGRNSAQDGGGPVALQHLKPVDNELSNKDRNHNQSVGLTANIDDEPEVRATADALATLNTETHHAEKIPSTLHIQDSRGNQLAECDGSVILEHLRQMECRLRVGDGRQDDGQRAVHSELASVMRDMLMGLVESPAEIRLLSDQQTFDTDGVLVAQVGSLYVAGDFIHEDNIHSQSQPGQSPAVPNDSPVEIVEVSATEASNSEMTIVVVMEHQGERVRVQFTFYDNLPPQYRRYLSGEHQEHKPIKNGQPITDKQLPLQLVVAEEHRNNAALAEVVSTVNHEFVEFPTSPLNPSYLFQTPRLMTDVPLFFRDNVMLAKVDIAGFSYLSVQLLTINLPACQSGVTGPLSASLVIDEDRVMLNMNLEIDGLIVAAEETFYRTVPSRLLLSGVDGIRFTALRQLPDMISLDISEPLRVVMPCGHVIGPESLFKYCSYLLSQRNSEFTCASCSRVWDYSLVSQVACLSVDERHEFEERLSVNFITTSRDMQRCPGCYTWCSRFTDAPNCRKVSCPICSTTKGHIFYFCWVCLTEWQDGGNECGNISCQKAKQDTIERLASCPEKPVAGVMCYSERACPGCSSVIEHTDKCTHIECRICSYHFCFVCLKLYDPFNDFAFSLHVIQGCDSATCKRCEYVNYVKCLITAFDGLSPTTYLCSSPWGCRNVAPRQTSLDTVPYWEQFLREGRVRVISSDSIPSISSLLPASSDGLHLASDTQLLKSLDSAAENVTSSLTNALLSPVSRACDNMSTVKVGHVVLSVIFRLWCSYNHYTCTTVLGIY